LVGFCFASIFWSDSPIITARRYFGLFGITVFAVYLAYMFSYKEIERYIINVFLFCALLTIFISFMFPEFGTDPKHFGAWHGAFVHKNQTGRFFALAFLFLASCYVAYRKSEHLIGCGIVAIPLLASGSRTAFVCIFILFYLIMIYHLYYRRGGVILFIAAVYTLMLLVLFYYFDGISFALDLMDRDVTLTGRTEIWGVAFQAYQERPLFGYGYRSFWVDENPIIRYLFGPRMTGHGHNSYVDILVELGFLGSILCGICFSAMSITLCKFLFKKFDYGIVFVPAFLFSFVSGLSAADVLDQNSFIWLLTLYSYFYARRIVVSQL
jgi:exopolysaccharide production protein ExoQ